MAKILYLGGNGSENPANAAVEAGHEAEIHIFGDAVVLMKNVVANSVVPVGWPPLKEILAATIKNKIPIYV
jgi:predicted peroxiredoxin